MTLYPLNLYGSLPLLREKKGLTEWVCLGQVEACGAQPVILSITLESRFTQALTSLLGVPPAEKYAGRHACLDLCDAQETLPAVHDGQGGSALLLHLEGTLDGITSKNTFFKKRVKAYEGVTQLRAKVRNESETFSNIEYDGKVRLDGPDYMKEALPSLLTTGYEWKREEAREYECGKPFSPMKFQLVVKEQYLSFV